VKPINSCPGATTLRGSVATIRQATKMVLKYRKMLMRLIYSCLSIIIFSISLYAQSSMEGKKSLEFTFQGLNLGGGIGGKYWLNDISAIRTTLSGSLSTFDTDEAISYSYDPYTVNVKTQILKLNVTYLRAISNDSEVLPYYGVSSGIDHYSSQSKAVHVSGIIDERRSTEDFLQLSAIVGIELRLYKSVSLSGEQWLSYFSRISKNGISTSEYRITTATSTLLISLYF